MDWAENQRTGCNKQSQMWNQSLGETSEMESDDKLKQTSILLNTKR